MFKKWTKDRRVLVALYKHRPWQRLSAVAISNVIAQLLKQPKSVITGLISCKLYDVRRYVSCLFLFARFSFFVRIAH
ncbi:MAG: hypothetical protein DCF26_16480 [Burkholderiales bacterium]|nr:MAG: hypothetical protein DCF26_16480 [Burkholderiales bacterium]